MTDGNLAARVDVPRALLDLAMDRLEPEEIEATEVWLRAEGLIEPPPWVVRRAQRIARQRRPARQPSMARRLVAALTFDSRVQPQYVGLRAARTHVRRLLLQAENIEVDLEVTQRPGAEQVRLIGQVTAGGADPSGGHLRLSTAGREWNATLDSTGEFWLDGIDHGVYRLEVSFRDRVVEVPILPL